MTSDELRAVVEAILLTAGRPVAPTDVAEAIDEPGLDAETVTHCLETLQAQWEAAGGGARLESVAGGWRVVTAPGLDPYLRAYHGVAARQRLSQAALEALAIVAHRQPVTLPEISFIRGTGSAAVVRTLLERKLLKVAGRKKVVGKPFLYRTSKEFLVHFGLSSADELPDPEELLAIDEAALE